MGPTLDELLREVKSLTSVWLKAKDMHPAKKMDIKQRTALSTYFILAVFLTEERYVDIGAKVAHLYPGQDPRALHSRVFYAIDRFRYLPRFQFVEDYVLHRVNTKYVDLAPSEIAKIRKGSTLVHVVAYMSRWNARLSELVEKHAIG